MFILQVLGAVRVSMVNKVSMNSYLTLSGHHVLSLPCTFVVSPLIRYLVNTCCFQGNYCHVTIIHLLHMVLLQVSDFAAILQLSLLYMLIKQTFLIPPIP